MVIVVKYIYLLKSEKRACHPKQGLYAMSLELAYSSALYATYMIRGHRSVIELEVEHVFYVRGSIGLMIHPALIIASIPRRASPDNVGVM